jgi:hypothetical protein
MLQICVAHVYISRKPNQRRKRPLADSPLFEREIPPKAATRTRRKQRKRRRTTTTTVTRRRRKKKKKRTRKKIHR